jgi:pimeloyl-ACP methyl ester carboxylesterase
VFPLFLLKKPAEPLMPSTKPFQAALSLGFFGLLAATGAAVAPASEQMCASSAWTGTVSYARSQSLTHSKTVERVSNRGRDMTDFQMSNNYKALIGVTESPELDGSNVARATVNHKGSSRETTVAKETNSCDQGKSWQEMTGTFVNEILTTGTGTDAANVTVGVNDDGTYEIGVSAPRIQGTTSGLQSSSFSGQCTKNEGKNTSYPATPTGIEGGSLRSDGRNRVDPANPTRLSGSYSETQLGVTQSITWNLQKCGAPLRITDLKFEDMKFPNWNDWREIIEQTGTVDGNWVRVTATVLNASADRRSGVVSFKETFKGDKWDAAKPDAPLKDHTIFVDLEPGEAKDVQLLWDSSGYAWFDDGRPRLVQRVKAELWEKNKLVNDLTRNIKIAPKPLVLVHGPWASWKTFETWQNILTTTHSYDWKAFPVGEVTNKGIINTGRDMFSSEQTNTTAQNADTLQNYIRYAQENRNAWHVDVVAHSVGGIIARNYITRLMPAYDDGRPQISHLVMLGTPNMGTPCADVMDFAFQMTGTSPRVIQEMRQDSMATFNQQNANRKGVKFSSLAGNPLPTMCKSIVWNDGFVPVASAHWTIADRALSKSLHPELTGTVDFSDFVKPHVAIGPRGDHGPALTDSRFFQQEAQGYFLNVGLNAGPNVDNRPEFAKAVTVGAKQSLDIEIPVTKGPDFGVTFMAAREVSATLLDEKGTVVGKNLSTEPAAGAAFRSIYFDKAVSGGPWKLRLENTAAQPMKAIVAGWSNAVKPGAARGLVAAR